MRAEVERIAAPLPRMPFLLPSGERLMELHVTDPNSPFFAASVPRLKLRQLLLAKLRPDAVEWNRRPVAYRQEGESVVLSLEDGSERRADLVIAADGARSRLRAQLTPEPLVPLGLSAIRGIIPDTRRHPLLEGGSFMTLGKGCSLLALRLGDQKMLWSFTTQAHPGELAKLTPDMLKRRVLEATRGWHEPISAMVEEGDDIGTRDYFDRPPPKRCVDGRVVFIGDAAHPMTPFRGKGANMAMMDALALATSLGEMTGDVTTALAGFERTMLPRNRKAVAESHKAAASLHTANPLRAWGRNLSYRMLQRVLTLSAQKAERGGKAKVTPS